MEAIIIYNLLRSSGLSRAGALGMLGNMAAESTPALKANIAQRGMTNLSDEVYTAAADKGMIDFAGDKVGFGLCQWTLKSRKAALLARSKEEGVSVGDGAMQVGFCIDELKKDFTALYDALCNSDDIDACAEAICRIYESPAVNNIEARRRYAHDVEKRIPENSYQQATNDPVAKTFPPDATIIALQMWMGYNGYWDSPITGYKSDYFFKQLEQFVADMKNC